MRAVTFQSMLRTSSPAWYSRTSANSIPCPLKTDRYSPVNSELTSPRVRSSMSFTWRRISGGTPRVGGAESGRREAPSRVERRALRVERSRPLGFARFFWRQNSKEGLTAFLSRSTLYAQRSTRHASRALDLRQHLRHDLVARDFLGLGFIRREHTVTQDVGRDRLHVVGCDERATTQEGV